MEQNPKAKRGYSRDKRPDCLQLVIALVGPDPPGDCVCFQQILFSFEIDPRDEAALSGAVRPGKDGEGRHVSSRSLVKLADDLVVFFARHPCLQRFNPGASTRGYNRRYEVL